MVAGNLEVSREAVTNRQQLRRDWEDLESRAEPTVFLSW